MRVVRLVQTVLHFGSIGAVHLLVLRLHVGGLLLKAALLVVVLMMSGTVCFLHEIRLLSHLRLRWRLTFYPLIINLII